MTVLGIGLAAIAAALALTVTGVAMLRAPGNRSITAGFAMIETSYGGAVAGRASSGDDEFTLPPLLDRLRGIAAALSPGAMTSSLARKLDLAGNPGGWTVEKVLAYKGLGLFVAAGFGLLLGSGSLATMLGYALLAGPAGFFLPDLLLHNAANQRQQAIRKSLPDTLDMLTVCVEAGLGFDAALSQVADNTEGPLAAEFLKMLQQMQLGKSRVEALRALSERSTVAELRAFTSALVQASELGIPTGQVLREQAKEMRTKQRQLAEEKAQKLPVKILFPLMFCIFPALFIVVLGPAAISLMAAFTG